MRPLSGPSFLLVIWFLAPSPSPPRHLFGAKSESPCVVLASRVVVF